MQVAHIVGARPNFMKLAPVVRALARYPNVEQRIIHTGQHYDFNMSDVFFQQLGIGAPDVNLKVGSGTHAQQTAEIMLRLEPVLMNERPDLVLVYGDVNSTAAAALVCAKLGVRVGHVEAGLRSFDRAMPEEINRLITDQLSDLLFTPSQDGDENLSREGVESSRVHFVGNVMIDTLQRMLPKAMCSLAQDLPSRYMLVTLHRPSNVDDLPWLAKTLDVLERFTGTLPVLFPLHPRTREKIQQAGIDLRRRNLRMLEPQPYIQFLGLQARASLVITDSGGIQEETTFLNIPCLTVRDNTERPITVTCGTNELIGRNPEALAKAVERALHGERKKSIIPPLWDGHSGERIAEIVVSRISSRSPAYTSPQPREAALGT